MKKLLFVFIICCSFNGFGQVEIYDSLNIGNEINSFSISIDKKHIVTSAGKKSPDLLIIDMVTKEIVKKIKVHSKAIRRIQFSPNGKYLATGSSDNSITILNAENYEVLHKLNGSQKIINDLCFFGEDRLATSSVDGTVVLWDIIKGEQINLFDTKCKYISWLSYDSEKSVVLISANNIKEKNSILYFLNETLQPVNQIKIDFMCTVKYLPECQMILAENSKTHVVSSIDSQGRIINDYNRHEDWVYYFVGINKCEYIVSTSHDKSLKIYKNDACIFNMNFEGKTFKIEKLSDNNFACMDMNGVIIFIRIN